MASPGYLITRADDMQTAGRAVLGIGLAIYVVRLLLLLAGRPSAILLMHGHLVILTAFAIYGWMMFPIAVGFVISTMGLAMAIWGWTATQASLLGLDALALAGLSAIAGVQQHRRTLRLHRLEQTLDDLGEGCFLKEQDARIAQETHEALQRKLSRYQELHAVAERLSRLLDLDPIVQLAVDRAFELIGKSDACLLFLVDQDRQELSLVASTRIPQVSMIRTKQGDQFDRYVLRTQRPLLVNDVRRDFRFNVAGASDRPLGSVIACPILIGETAEGVLRLDSRQAGAYTQDDLRLLDILLGLVETAMTNARLFAKTQQLALTDGLTGLFRRQPFLDRLTRELARAARSHEPLAVLMLDLDDFKRYNDTHGHPAGDLALRETARLVRATMPPDAMCARYGGEEFAVLLPRTSREAGVQIAQRLRDIIAQTLEVPRLRGERREMVSTSVARVGSRASESDGALKSSEPLEGVQRHKAGEGITVSIGVAIFPNDAQAELELIRVADQRLYQAKRAGKNRVCAS
ncbi:MAG: GGDEF domain-containing protein [Candidatus Omnitrophica bacterium]|nr:GGDEF domain-containing protein [Candidatus Omnitrophota bacterium]